MQWLPQTYRIIFTKELPFNSEQMEYIETKLNSYIDDGCLFCSLDEKLPKIVARVVNIKRKNNKLCMWLDEVKYGIFNKLNVHFESYYIDIVIDYTFTDSNPSILNILKLKELKNAQE